MASAGRRALGLTVFMLRSVLCVGSSGVGPLCAAAAPPCFVLPAGRACGTAGERRRPRGHGRRFFAAAAGEKGAKAMALDRLLQQQGFGTRKLCQTLVKEGYVTIMGRPATDPRELVVPEPGMQYTVDDEEWEYHVLSYILLNKPPGYECSQKPSAHPSVMDLLPSPFRERGVQSVGRLDVDTTGLLLLTDDGKFAHTITSPKHLKSKVYHVTCKHALEDRQIQAFLGGVELKDEPGLLVRAVAAEQMSSTLVALTVTEGKYHQIKRMVAAVGNRCEGLHRVSIAGLQLPADLEEGEWRYLTPPQVEALLA